MQQVTSAQIASKFKSKYEIHCKCQPSSITFTLLVFLTVDCGYYIPASEHCTIYWMKDLFNGSKKAIEGKDIVHIACPQFETITTVSILAFGHSQSNTLVDYLPILKEQVKLPRQFIINVTFAVVGKPFSDWIKAQVEERNRSIAAKRDLLVNMDPRIAQKLAESNHVSIAKGKSAHLLVSTITHPLTKLCHIESRKQATPR